MYDDGMSMDGYGNDDLRDSGFNMASNIRVATYGMSSQEINDMRLDMSIADVQY